MTFIIFEAGSRNVGISCVPCFQSRILGAAEEDEISAFVLILIIINNNLFAQPYLLHFLTAFAMPLFILATLR